MQPAHNRHRVAGKVLIKISSNKPRFNWSSSIRHLPEFQLPKLPFEITVHVSQNKAHRSPGHEAALEGAQGRLNLDLRENAHTKANGSASIWSLKNVDGVRPFSELATQPDQYQDGPACARLQSETSSQSYRN